MELKQSESLKWRLEDLPDDAPDLRSTVIHERPLLVHQNHDYNGGSYGIVLMFWSAFWKSTTRVLSGKARLYWSSALEQVLLAYLSLSAVHICGHH